MNVAYAPIDGFVNHRCDRYRYGDEPITLAGTFIRLVPLSLSHHPALCAIGLAPQLWQQTTIRLQTPDDMLHYIQTALSAQTAGTTLPFVLITQGTDTVVGTTRYHTIVREHRRLEIGFTWVAIPWQRTAVNTEAKYLLLRHAFEHYQCVRVEFKADSQNDRSCRALLRIGAKPEGILRNYMLSAHKGVRNAALFSIIDSEWPQVKADLEHTLYAQMTTAKEQAPPFS